jgi:hypothetical protein
VSSGGRCEARDSERHTTGCQSNTTAWNVYLGQSNNALNSGANFNLAQISDHPIHTGGVCTQGTACQSAAAASRAHDPRRRDALHRRCPARGCPLLPRLGGGEGGSFCWAADRPTLASHPRGRGPRRVLEGISSLACDYRFVNGTMRFPGEVGDPEPVGASTGKSRSTRSGARGCSVALIVAPFRRFERTETRPAWRIQPGEAFLADLELWPSRSSACRSGEPIA